MVNSLIFNALMCLFLGTSSLVGLKTDSSSRNKTPTRNNEIGENLVKDGDFDSGDSSHLDWNFSSLAGKNVHEIQNVISIEGNAMKLFGSGDSTPKTYFTHNGISVENNYIYKFEYYVKVENASQNLQFSTFATDTDGSFYTDFSSKVLTSNTDGWLCVSSLITMPKKKASTSYLVLGFEYYNGTGTIYIDNVSLRKIMSAEGIEQNYSFEYQYEGTPINWTFSGDGEFIAQKEVMPDAQTGEYTAKITHISSAEPSYIQSQKIPVIGGQTYEISYYGKTVGDYTADAFAMFVQYKADNQLAYSIGFDANQPNNNYQSQPNEPEADKNKNGRQFINPPSYMYHQYGETDWRRNTFHFTPSKDATFIYARVVLLGNNAATYIDDINIKLVNTKKEDEGIPTINNVDENTNFEKVEFDGKPTNWYVSNSRSYRTLLTSDDTFFKEGKRSLYLESEGTLEYTTIENAAKMEIDAGDIYEFSAYFSSRNADPHVKIRMNLYYFDKNGNNIYNEYGDCLYVYGETSSCNAGSNKDQWKQLYTRSAIPAVAKYVSYSFVITGGHIELWLDDLVLMKVEGEELGTEKLEFHSHFDKMDSDGVVDGFILNEKNKAQLTIGKDSTEFFVFMGNNVKLTKRIYSFITNYQYHFLFNYNADSSGYVRIDFYNQFDVLLDGESLIRTFDQNSDPIDFYFLAPSSTYAIISIGMNGPGILNLLDLYIYQTHVPASKGAWDAQWVWYSEDAPKNPEQYRYFRYTFELPSKATYAPLQLTVDDKYVLYVNGQFIDFNWDAGSDSWANVHVYFLQDYLVPGKNVIALKAYNLVSEAGVLFDGKFTLENGQQYACLSSKEVKSTLPSPELGDVNINETAVPIWAMPDYDDSSWEFVKECGMPPTSPWGPVYYDSSLYVDNELEIVGIDSQKKIEAGKTLKFSVTFIAKNKITSNFNFSVGIVQSDTSDDEKNVQKSNLKIVSNNADLTLWPVNEEVKVDFEIQISSLIDAGWYDLRLESNVVTITNEDIFNNRFLSFRVLESTQQQSELVSSVEYYNGAPAIMVNGKPYSPTLYLRPDLDVYRQTDAEDRMTNSTYELYITYQGCLGKNGQDQLLKKDYTLDYEAFDDAIISLLNASVDGYVMVNFGMFAPSWWMKENPDEVVYSMDLNGKKLQQEGVSFSSEKWMNLAGECLQKLIEHMKTQKYYNRVFGLRITAGQTYEFMNYGAGAKYMPDYSGASEKGFRKYLEEKYKDIETVKKVYGNDKLTSFEDITIPTLVERGQATYTTLLSPNYDMWKIDYNNYLTSKSADCLLYWAKIAKEASEFKKIVGAYYGYMWTFGSYDGASSTHTALIRILESEYIDFIASPYNYNEKVFGMSSTFMSMADTVQAYGKVYILEEDNRTYNTDGFSGVSWDASWDYQVGECHTPQDTIYQFRRDFANNFVNGTGFWHYDMYGGWVDDDQMYEAMAREKTIYSNAYYFDDTSYLNDVAVFVDDNTYTYYSVDTTYNTPYILNSVMLMEQRENLNRMGVGYDTYTMSSITSGKVKPHKVNIFLSPYEINAEENNLIQQYLKESDGYAIWIYGAGYSDGTVNTDTLSNMKAVTGFDIGMNVGSYALQTQIYDMDNPLIKGLANKRFGTHSQFISPQFYIKDTDTSTKLGFNTQGGQASLGVKEFNGYKSIYSSSPCLPTNFFRNVLKEANVHIYSENNNDIIYSNSRYVALHSVVSEEKTINLPKNYAVYDEFMQEYVSLDTNVIKYHHNANDTKLFRLDPVGGVKIPPEEPKPIDEKDKLMQEFITTTCVIVAVIAGIILLRIFVPKIWKRRKHA